ncbi:unnamed protein product [Notodromas monacha]|uniref:Selenoprotein P N-terminal domain-containing protein n=1 Tax=Notodromas monacha TaxID=399045 RepID=A0A7R9GJ01_9CRUS|nr:unnamed protein product [Notodromas monacha]CAG0923001.1 unnamed protein product [Notodromas monacha]
MLVKPRTAAVVGVIGVALAILGAGAGAQDPDADPQSHTCLPTKKWSIKGEDVVANSRGNVTLVALLSASCGFCIRQAFFISLLKDRMEQEGHYFNAAIVNEASMLSMLYSLKLQEATSLKIPVYQETHQDPVWEILGGSRDDILLYDRCGRLAFHIPMPFSDILSPFQFVQKSLKQVLENKDLCGPCQDEALDTEETQEAQQEPQQEQIEVPAEIVQEIEEIQQLKDDLPTDEDEIEEIQQLKDDLPTDEDEPKKVQCTVVFDETTSTSVTNCEDPAVVLQLPSDLDVVKEVLPPPMDALEETEIDIKLQRLDDVDGEDFALPATDLEPLNRAEHAPSFH